MTEAVQDSSRKLTHCALLKCVRPLECDGLNWREKTKKSETNKASLRLFEFSGRSHIKVGGLDALIPRPNANNDKNNNLDIRHIRVLSLSSWHRFISRRKVSRGMHGHL